MSELYLQRRRILIDPFASPRPALFLDRDGVLIEDRHYISDPNDVVLCLGAKQLLERASWLGWPVVIITNQSGIQRGLFDWKAYELVTDQLIRMLSSPRAIAGIYANGYGPAASPTSWRKPSPAMLLAAASDLNIDLSRSILIGDRLSDLKAGASAGLNLLVHVLTGHGCHERLEIRRWFVSMCSANQDRLPPWELLLLNELSYFPVNRLSGV